jgi:tRNA threonylcarbamoyl adenosine modification protein YeaZ
MLNLAIECSGIAGSVALFDGGQFLTEISLPNEEGSVRSLAAAIEAVLKTWVWGEKRRIELISVTHGPGSFTGLRVGLATAQMFGLAWGIPIAPVDTLAAIALRASGPHSETEQPNSRSTAVIVPVINAYRRQVFVGGWRASSPARLAADGSPGAAVLQQIAPSQVVDAAVWQAQPWSSLNRDPSASLALAHLPQASQADADVDLPLARAVAESLPSQVLVCGPGLRTYLPQPQLGVQLADADRWDPTASCVGRLGWELFQRGQAVTAHTLRPNYVRRSAAEENSSR